MNRSICSKAGTTGVVMQMVKIVPLPFSKRRKFMTICREVVSENSIQMVNAQGYIVFAACNQTVPFIETKELMLSIPNLLLTVQVYFALCFTLVPLMTRDFSFVIVK